MKENNYAQRVAKIMPVFTFWGDGIVLVTRKEWLKAERRIESILKQLHKQLHKKGA